MLTERYRQSVKELDRVIKKAFWAAMEKNSKDEFFSGRMRLNRLVNVEFTRHNENYIEITGGFTLCKEDAETLGKPVRKWSVKIHHQPHPDYHRHPCSMQVHFVTCFDLIHEGKLTTGGSTLLEGEITEEIEEYDLKRILASTVSQICFIGLEDPSRLNPLDGYEHLYTQKGR